MSFFDWLKSEKHLQGRHDQATHGNRAGAGDQPSAYNRAEFGQMDMAMRRGKWGAMNERERDRQAAAATSVSKAQQELLAPAGRRPARTRDVQRAIGQRINQIGDLVPDEARQTIQQTANELDSYLAQIGVSPRLRYDIAMDAVDSLAAQDRESIGRQLGDHGAHHLRGNIDMAMAILAEHPGADTPEQAAEVYLANIYHDAGYLTEPAREFLDEGHPRWSEQHYNANVRPRIEQALGAESANEISHLIRTHAATDIDWRDDAAASAVRLSDNLGLFQKEKLPGVFRYVPENTNVLARLHTKEINLATAQKEMHANIDAASLSDPVKAQLHKAANEVMPMTGKFTLGMLGGAIKGFKWQNGMLQVYLRKSARKTMLQKFMDLGQRQFAKLAEAYGLDPNQFTKSLQFTLEGVRGPVLQALVTEEKSR